MSDGEHFDKCDQCGEESAFGNYQVTAPDGQVYDFCSTSCLYGWVQFLKESEG